MDRISFRLCVVNGINVDVDDDDDDDDDLKKKNKNFETAICRI